MNHLKMVTETDAALEAAREKTLADLEAAKKRVIRLLHFNIEGYWPGDTVDLLEYYEKVKREAIRDSGY